MSRLRRALRNPYLLIGEGFLFGGLILLVTQGGREAAAAPAAGAVSARAR